MAAMLGRLPGELSVEPQSQERAANVKAVAKGIKVKKTLGDLVDNADILALALPAHALNAVVSELGDHARPDQLVLHGMRGVDGSGRLPQILKKGRVSRRLWSLVDHFWHLRLISASR